MHQRTIQSKTLDIVKTYIVTNFLFGGSDDIAPDQSLVEAGIIDSTGVMELVAFLEDRFVIEISDQDLTPDNLDSLSRIAVFVDGKLQSR